MQDVFQPLELADYTFLVEVLEGRFTLFSDGQMRRLLADVEAHDTPEARAALNQRLEQEVRYLGSSEILYWTRSVTGQEAGASFPQVVRDVARALKVEAPPMGTAREQVAHVVEQYVTKQFASLTPEAQQQMLVEAGAERENAAAFIKKSAGVFALPLLIQTFDVLVVQVLLKQVIFGTIAKIIGQQLAGKIFTFLAGRFPWWLRWVGPVAWTASIGWTVFDLQGPALRKTIPAVLYLGLCALREKYGTGAGV